MDKWQHHEPPIGEKECNHPIGKTEQSGCSLTSLRVVQPDASRQGDEELKNYVVV
jgi:hypothetical protein